MWHSRGDHLENLPKNTLPPQGMPWIPSGDPLEASPGSIPWGDPRGGSLGVPRGIPLGIPMGIPKGGLGGSGGYGGSRQAFLPVSTTTIFSVRKTAPLEDCQRLLQPTANSMSQFR